MPKKICPNCGKTVQLRKERVYCSNKCRLEATKQRRSRNCVVCQRSFAVRTLETKCCSQVCAIELGRKTVAAKYADKPKKPHKPPVKVVKRCPHCYRSYQGRKRQKYCDRICSNLARAGISRDEYLVEFECKKCLKLCQIRSSRIRSGANDGVYCSIDCYQSNLKPTSIENKIGRLLDFMGVAAISQHRVGRYLADFCISDIKLIIECDGDYWHSRPDAIIKDRLKDDWYAKAGYHVLRLSESEINNHIDNCKAKIEKFLEPS